MADVPLYYSGAVPAHLVPWDQLAENQRCGAPQPAPAGYLLVELFDGGQTTPPRIDLPVFSGSTRNRRAATDNPE